MLTHLCEINGIKNYTLTVAYSLIGDMSTVSFFWMYPVSILPAAQNPPLLEVEGLKMSEIDIRKGFSIKRGGLRRLSIAFRAKERAYKRNVRLAK